MNNLKHIVLLTAAVVAVTPARAANTWIGTQRLTDNFQDAKIAIDASGNALAVLTAPNADGSVSLQSRSRANGKSWGALQTLIAKIQPSYYTVDLKLTMSETAPRRSSGPKQTAYSRRTSPGAAFSVSLRSSPRAWAITTRASRSERIGGAIRW